MQTPKTRIHLRQGAKAGLGPGALVHVGVPPPAPARLTVIEYSGDTHEVRDIVDLAKEKTNCRGGEGTVVWVNVEGINNPETIAALGERFGLHALVLEDVMNAGERIKLEEYDGGLFVVLKMLDVERDLEQVLVEQVSFVMGPGYVISFQEKAGDVFDGVRERLAHHKGKVRRMGADYLLYVLMDAIVDHYAVALDAVAELVADMEEKLQGSAEAIEVKDLYVLKREVSFLRRQIAPARDVFAQLCHLEDDDLLSDAVDLYFRDILDHCTRATEHADALRDMTISLLDMYHSLQSARLNEVMRILTVISTLFIPLTFIAGIYGMNFDIVPELHHPRGYFACLGIMAAVAVGMLIYIRRNRWL